MTIIVIIISSIISHLEFSNIYHFFLKLKDEYNIFLSPILDFVDLLRFFKLGCFLFSPTYH